MPWCSNFLCTIFNRNKNMICEIQDYIDDMVSKKYYIITIIDDLLLHYNFIINSDSIINDVRTINLKKNDNIIIIESKIISYMNEEYTQRNAINFRNDKGQIYNWDYKADCYKT